MISDIFPASLLIPAQLQEGDEETWRISHRGNSCLSNRNIGNFTLFQIFVQALFMEYLKFKFLVCEKKSGSKQEG